MQCAYPTGADTPDDTTDDAQSVATVATNAGLTSLVDAVSVRTPLQLLTLSCQAVLERNRLAYDSEINCSVQSPKPLLDRQALWDQCLRCRSLVK